ncbi:DUF4179 domain-containing protein [Paenibacillus sp.]|jgi:hypothetical protein|uniref:DUF4179 domain-containing protein n=1 Tax=Paenibacillus sp. TaxID=58172 RepID=UPI002828D0FE|nr:DUF4179 domain-containing protein [Paenibacillus sp.]MDR0269008.1 DUF4179 domain-containing protein [Paenibacillus sp.]
MSRFYENEIKENIPTPPRPDYDEMWLRIDREAAKRRATGVVRTAPPARSRKKFIPAAIVFSCFMVAAVPVFAGVSFDWGKLYGGQSITNALDNDIGQRYDDLDVASKGVTMSLKGVVTDGERMKLLVVVDTPMKPSEYDEARFDHVVIKDDSGKKLPVNGYLKYDEKSGKLLGIYETEDTLKNSEKNYTLEAVKLVYLKNKEVVLKEAPKAGETVSTGEALYPSFKIESVRESQNLTDPMDQKGLIVRYNLTTTDEKTGGNYSPHLTVVSNREETKNVRTFIFPPKGTEMKREQLFNNMTEKEWSGSEVHFNYLKEMERIEGDWSLHFKADGKKASEAVYSKPLQTTTEFKDKAAMSLDHLTVTPLQIIVNAKDNETVTNGVVRDKYAISQYRDARLKIGDQEITGYYTTKGDFPNNKDVFVFESPEWYKDWSKVPMKLILRKPVVSARDIKANWLELNRPTAEKQSGDLDVNSFKLHFTYYMDGKDLVVESVCNSENFKNMSQSMLRVDGEYMYAEYNPSNIGFDMPSKKIERYPDFSMKQSLEINPGFYSYYDSSREAEITLQQ